MTDGLYFEKLAEGSGHMMRIYQFNQSMTFPCSHFNVFLNPSVQSRHIVIPWFTCCLQKLCFFASQRHLNRYLFALQQLVVIGQLRPSFQGLLLVRGMKGGIDIRRKMGQESRATNRWIPTTVSVWTFSPAINLSFSGCYGFVDCMSSPDT